MMKKSLLLLLVFLIIIALFAYCALQTEHDKVLRSLGKPDSEQFWSHGSFQDYTDFGIYTFSSADLDNKYFQKISEPDIEALYGYFDDFEKWVNLFKENEPNDELASNYSFERSAIDTNDYFYIYEKDESSKYENYSVYFYDTQTNKLYYFHNNT